jgi:phosphohistidine phosphatase SixA
VLAELVSAEPDVVERDELSPAGDLEELLAWTNQAAAHLDSVAWVGHAPDVDEMAASLIGDATARIRFTKGAIAAIEFDAGLQLGKGTLRWLVTAKMLGL